MQSHVRLAGLATIALVLASSCAPETSVVKLYEDPARPAKTYQRLLVVDISSDHSRQQQFENEVVTQLRRLGTDAIPSFTMLDTSNGVIQEEVDRAGEEVGADGILMTHIASVDTEVDVQEGREEWKSTCRGGDPVDYFLYDRELIAEPDSVNMALTLVVISNLYDGESRERIWTIQSTCFDKKSVSEALIEEAYAIAQQLHIDGLID